ncbi:MAG: hypothetical protein SPJ84_06670 [Fusobacterium gastrosuis]|uniref:hypothetical protein n=1 Tax=Fusobacterium gastrosuis TaxID=1755100 RepID=UPI002A9801F1|nr:hypothetical protein [Fusobacterium gastrosuis]
MEKIIFPNIIRNDFKTIKFFNDLLADCDKEIFYSMENVNFFDASMVTYFHSINRQLYKTHEKIFYDKIQNEIEAFFLKNKYAKNFNIKYLNLELEDIHKTYIEFTTMNKDDDSAFYIITKNIVNKKLINFNNEMQAAFLTLIGEMANNSYEHGKTNVAYFCGQYYPKIKKLSFSISNLGNTIVENVKSKEANFSNLECFKWIFKLGTTTRKDGTSGGQGLYELKNLVKKLNGDITIISGNDYFHINKEQEEIYKRLENNYSGTTFIINIFYDRGVEYEDIKN